MNLIGLNPGVTSELSHWFQEFFGTYFFVCIVLLVKDKKSKATLSGSLLLRSLTIGASLAAMLIAISGRRAHASALNPAIISTLQVGCLSKYKDLSECIPKFWQLFGA